MTVFPVGIALANGDSEKLQPIPKMTSELRRKCGTVFGWALPPEPSARGWVSLNELLPGKLVQTGMASSSASSCSSL